MTVNESQQMVFGNVIFQPEIVEQRLRAGLSPHHDQQASDNGDEQQHQQEL